MKKFIYGLIAAILIALALLIIPPLVITIAGIIGNYVGIVVSFLIGGLLTGILGIEEGTIPTIMAWLFVIGAIFGGGIRVGSKED
jgi:hypothetical protein